MTIRLLSGFAVIIASLIVFPAHAQQAPLNTIPVIPLDPPKPEPKGPQFGFVLGGAIEFGGDKLATVSFTDGSSQNIRAGQGVSGFVGGTVRPSFRSPWSLRATVGYKYNTTSASNADINFERVPLELIGSYHFKNGARVGTGVLYHTAIKLSGDGFFEDVKFKDAAGFKLEAGWRWVVVSYNNLKYHAKNFDASADASNFGLTFLWEFGQP